MTRDDMNRLARTIFDRPPPGFIYCPPSVLQATMEALGKWQRWHRVPSKRRANPKARSRPVLRPRLIDWWRKRKEPPRVVNYRAPRRRAPIRRLS